MVDGGRAILKAAIERVQIVRCWITLLPAPVTHASDGVQAFQNQIRHLFCAVIGSAEGIEVWEAKKKKNLETQNGSSRCSLERWMWPDFVDADDGSPSGASRSLGFGSFRDENGREEPRKPSRKILTICWPHKHECVF